MVRTIYYIILLGLVLSVAIIDLIDKLIKY